MERTTGYLEPLGGVISVVAFSERKIPERSTLLLLVGPTGAGKSSFIESFSRNDSHPLSISKNQLEGYTQTVTAYELTTFSMYDNPVFLIDTPGFCDSKISEIEVLDMIRNWLFSNGVHYVHHIYFFIPINMSRLTGSRWRTIYTFKSLLKRQFSQITFLTTMWDELHNRRVWDMAESRFEQLRDEVFSEFIDEGATMTRFLNTHESSTNILLSGTTGLTNAFSKDAKGASPHGTALYHDVVARIKGCLQTKKVMEDDLATPDFETLPELSEIQQRKLLENSMMLGRLLSQYVKFHSTLYEPYNATLGLHEDIIANSGIFQPRSHYEVLLDHYDLIGSGSIRCPQMRRCLHYAYICERVNTTLDIMNATKLFVAQRQKISKTETNTHLVEQLLMEDEQELWKAIIEWIRFTDPPKVLDAITQDIRKKVIAHSGICRLDPLYEEIFYLWKHLPDWSLSIYQQPNASGIFAPPTYQALFKERRNYVLKSNRKSTL